MQNDDADEHIIIHTHDEIVDVDVYDVVGEALVLITEVEVDEVEREVMHDYLLISKIDDVDYIDIDDDDDDENYIHADDDELELIDDEIDEVVVKIDEHELIVDEDDDEHDEVLHDVEDDEVEHVELLIFVINVMVVVE